MNQVLFYTWEEREYDNIIVQFKVRNHRFREVGLQDMMLVKGEVDTSLTEVGIIKGVKSIEFVSVLLRRTVTSQQVTTEVDTHLRYHWRAIFVMCRSQFETRHQVLLSVSTKLTDRELRASEDDWLCEVLKHE